MRGVALSRDAAIRTALGAPRLRTTRSLLLESLLLACAGGVLGVLLARLGLRVLAAFEVAGFPRYRAVGLDGRALLVAAALVIGAGLACGLVPAWRLARSGVGAVIKRSHGTGGREAARLRSGMAIAEIALAVVLLIGAGLLLRSLQQLTGVDPGFVASDVLVQRIASVAGALPGGAPTGADRRDRSSTASAACPGCARRPR